MHILHQTEQVKTRIANSLSKASTGALRRFETDSVAHNAVVCKLALFRSEPASCKWVIWEQKEANYSNAESYRAFYDEEPVPDCQSQV